MLFKSTLAALSLSVSLVSAQAAADPNFATGLLAALTAANLTTLISVATTNAAVLLPLLQSGNLTVFAPTNKAFAALPASVLADTAAVLNLVSYHVVNGSFPPSSLTAAHTIGSTVLTSGPNVNLPKKEGQNIVLVAAPNGQASVVQPTSVVTSVVATKYDNLDIYVIDTLLSLPVNTTTTISALNLTILAGAIAAIPKASAEFIDSTEGITIFAPLDTAFASVVAGLAAANTSQAANALLTHIVPGAVTSNLLTTVGPVTTAAGNNLTFIANATGAYVIFGTIVAKVVKADVITKNGVVHVIDTFLGSFPAPAATVKASASRVAAGGLLAGLMTVAAFLI